MPRHILPVALAQNFAAIADGEYPKLAREFEDHPRLRELLWFIQAHSMRTGGIPAFVRSFLAAFKGHVGTETLHELRQRPAGVMSAREALRLYLECGLEGCSGTRRSLFESMERSKLELFKVLENQDFDEIDEGKTEFAKEQRAEIEKLNVEKLTSGLATFAEQELPRYLADYCHDPSHGVFTSGGPWFMRELPDLLVRSMDIHASKTIAQIAQTEVTRLIFDGLDYAVAKSTFVMIEGESRFGKTKSLETWCNARPGIARLVTVPCSNTEADFFRAIAKSLGLEFSLKTPVNELREKVEFVLEHSRLALVFDEAHWIIPTRYSKNTPPARLDWVRTAIIDRGLPCAMAVTPQSYGGSLRRFVGTTGYSARQFTGRQAFTVQLPKAIATEDILAVARNKFPNIDESLLGYIAGAAQASEGFLKTVEHIAMRSSFLAERERSDVAFKHVTAAIAEVAPEVAKKVETLSSRATRVAAPANRIHRDIRPREERTGAVEVDA